MNTIGSVRGRSGCFILALKIISALAILYLFRSEILLVWNLLRFVFARDRTTVVLPPQQEWGPALAFFLMGLFVVLAVGVVFLFLVAGVIFPVKSGRDQLDMVWRLLGFFMGSRQRVMWVREGRPLGDAPSQGGSVWGVALVDPNSAIVIENTRTNAQTVFSSGVRLIRSNEKFVAAVSLRRQSRSAKDVRVLTSDGIELTTSVNASFTLGEDPDVLKVAYVRDPYHPSEGQEHVRPTADQLKAQEYLNLRVLRIDFDGTGGGRIRAYENILDEDEKREIHEFALRYRVRRRPRLAAIAPDSDSRRTPPYVVDEQRILAAVGAQARRANPEGIEQWADIPVADAVARLRDEIARVRYDNLYMLPDFSFPSTDELLEDFGNSPLDPDLLQIFNTYPTDQDLLSNFKVIDSIGEEPTTYPLVESIRPGFGNMIRRLGVLSYQLILPSTGQAIKEDMAIDPKRFDIAPVRPFTSSRSLRDLGIKVNSAGFGDLQPSPEMQEKRVEHWAQRWKQEITDEELARRLAAAEVIKNNARARRYSILIRRMLAILEQPATNDLVLSRIVSTLRLIAQDQNTLRKLPTETVEMMEKIQKLLLPPRGA